jgi:hypothetical protein
MKLRKLKREMMEWERSKLEKLRAKPRNSPLMMMALFGLGNAWLFPKILSSDRKFLPKLMNLNSQSIWEETRCIKM